MNNTVEHIVNVDLTGTGIGCGNTIENCTKWCIDQSYSFLTKELMILPICITIVGIVMFWAYRSDMDDDKVAMIIDYGICLETLLGLCMLLQIYLMVTGRI